ncbi:unnamed protein product [Brassica rapa]|uniref:F-box domain-containing protein n=1 Tax=Brassica campestris TaxID=3711 RepID=A0A8D9FZF3_BRACM|nr:unnamed protein product [Brassica rapa]
MTTMSNLPEELVREILSRVPLTSLRKLRCTCRTWNALSKTQVFGKETARNQFLGFTVINGRVCSLRLDFQGIHNKGDLVHKSTKKISKLDHTKTEEVFHSDGLLLCVRNRSNFVVWNPYLGQTRCIPPASRDFRFYDMFCFGYDKNNRNHKILRFCYDNDESLFCFELFDFKTSSWRLLDIEPDVDLDVYRSGVSLKGNTYFVAQTNRPGVIDVLLCFDFTTERFWRPLPFHYDAVEHVVLSCVREEKLAVLYQIENTMEIWITTKIEYDDVSWSKFLEVEMTPLNGFDYDFDTETESFFIDEDKKFAVVGGECENKPICRYQTAHIIGQDGYLKSVRTAECPKPLVFSSYLPSLVQLEINQRSKRKPKDCFYQKKRKKLRASSLTRRRKSLWFILYSKR